VARSVHSEILAMEIFKARQAGYLIDTEYVS
jgi:hypothetical protein